MKTNVYYTAPAKLTKKAGLIETRYRNSDGSLFLLSETDVIRTIAKNLVSSDELVTGINGLTKITVADAKKFISDGGNNMGEIIGVVANDIESSEQSDDSASSDADANTSENSECSESEPNSETESGASSTETESTEKTESTTV